MTKAFTEGTSIIHTTPATVRVASATVLSSVTALAGGPVVPLVAVGLGFLLIMAARLNPTSVVKRLIPLTGFLLLIWAVLPFTGAGEVLGTLGPLQITSEGVGLATLISLKSYGIVMILMALVGTLHPFEMGHALGALGMPVKLTFLLVMSARYIDVLQKEFQKLRTAAKIRGFRPDTSLHTYRTLAHMVGMLLVRSHMRAARVYKAMVLRGFDGEFHRLTESRGQRFECKAGKRND